MRPLLPAVLKSKVPERRDPGPWPSDSHLTKVLLLNSCTQTAMMPVIDRATARVLDRLQVQAIIEPSSGCCGAIRYHLNDHPDVPRREGGVVGRVGSPHCVRFRGLSRRGTAGRSLTNFARRSVGIRTST